MQLPFDAWFYYGDEAKLFRAGDEIPDTFTDHPTLFNGAPESAFDHDGVNGPGGSVPKRRGRPPKVRQDGV